MNRFWFAGAKLGKEAKLGQFLSTIKGKALKTLLLETKMGPHRCDLRRRAKWMRKNPTSAERILWGKLRKRRLLDCKFRRQHILSPYIVDFYCFPAKLAVEVDGRVHSEPGSPNDDEHRDTRLREIHGVDILRFSNFEICHDLDDVLTTIKCRLHQALDTDD